MNLGSQRKLCQKKDSKVVEQWGYSNEVRALEGHRGGRTDAEIEQMIKEGVHGFTVFPEGEVMVSGNYAPFEESGATLKSLQAWVNGIAFDAPELQMLGK